MISLGEQNVLRNVDHCLHRTSESLSLGRDFCLYGVPMVNGLYSICNVSAGAASTALQHMSVVHQLALYPPRRSKSWTQQACDASL